MKALLSIVLGSGPKADLIARFDRWGRWAHPLAVLANFALAFLI